jgi:serine protease Do
MRSVLRSTLRAWLVAAAAFAILRAGADTPAPPERPQAGERTELPPAFQKPVPESIADLKAMEERLTSLIARVAPAVVGVSVGGATGSGVVISTNGLVLTAAHVCREPGRSVRFEFPDGTTARGRTLGTDHGMDAGMMLITDKGNWPSVPIGGAEDIAVGDWVLGLGHPGGFDSDRPPVARIGRVIRIRNDGLQTDCTLTAGDSGGPLFDMHGRVIGIHSRISESTAENYHVPIRSYWTTWERLVRGDNWGAERPSRAWVGVGGADHPEGCLVESVAEDGPASKAGLSVGDIVRTVNGRPVRGFDDFRRLIAETAPGDKIEFEVQRDGESRSLIVEVGSRRGR